MKRPLFSLTILGIVLWAAAAAAAEPVMSKDQIIIGLSRRTRGGDTIDLQVQFESNSARLTPQAVTQLEVLAQALADQALASNSFRIEGHTDSVGSAAYNQVLSERRAAAVKRFLVEHGVETSHLQARGFGESKPIADEGTPDGKDLNRRVAVVNLGSAGSVTAEDTPEKPIPPAVANAVVEKETTQPKTARQKSAGSPRVDVVVQYERNGQKDRVKPGTVLWPIDNYNVSFTPTTRSFVYVLQFDADGNVSVVFPNKEHSATVNPLVPHRSYVVPSEGRWLRIKGTPGEEEIMVLASGQEIDDPPGIAQTLRRQTRGVEPNPVKDATMPPDLFSYRLPYTTKLP